MKLVMLNKKRMIKFDYIRGIEKILRLKKKLNIILLKKNFI